ncbi:hypothetical protein EXE58_09155 [Nocardioides seonyuensis]|uniref:Ig-like domain-containing protein n=1 Tax=Nocardioides seonyuensis TaxID=2518371 RepID=A0A4V1BM96_9ACTN|nr:hypothetical protein [Nocardioides seonyuensis]QBX55602.1 hypothetical protein EXE58_09155 [Nocardioides seonyuensis]
MHTRSKPRAASRLAVTALGVLALTATASTAASPASALEPGTLSLTGPTSATVGSPAVMTASGHVPSDAYLERYVYVYSIPTSVVSACPAARTNALQLSSASSGQGGDTVAFVNVTGDFSVPIAYTPSHAGTFLLCGYLSEMVYDDATAQHVVTAVGAPAPPSPPAPPAPAPTSPPPAGAAATAPSSDTRPRVVQRGNRLVCKRGTWTDATSYSFRWKVGGRTHKGATSTRLRVTRAIRGRKVQCAVTGRNAVGSSTVLSRPLRAR